jgi:cold shock CspA family protein
VPNGTVVRFSRRFGYGFVAPDEGGEDVFVHQNNINMEGFRFLQVGERVSYELEVGEKGMKAVSVALTEPRQPRQGREENGDFAEQGERDQRDRGERGERDQRDRGEGGEGGEGGEQRPRSARPPRSRPSRGEGDAGGEVQKLRRKQERLITLLVEKGILAPGDIDGLDGSSVAKSIENQQV